MNLRSNLLLFEAAVSGLPTTAVIVYAFPYLIVGALAMLAKGNIAAILGLTGAIMSLVEFWKLGIHTALFTPHKFGLNFVFSVIGAVFGILTMCQGLPLDALAVFVGFPIVGAAHFSYLQISRKINRTIQ